MRRAQGEGVKPAAAMSFRLLRNCPSVTVRTMVEGGWENSDLSEKQSKVYLIQ